MCEQSAKFQQKKFLKHSFRLLFSTVTDYGASLVAQMLKNLPANAGDARDTGLIPRLERFPGEGNGNLLQYSCLGNPMDRGAWWATVHGGCKDLGTTELLSKHTHTHTHTYTPVTDYSF